MTRRKFTLAIDCDNAAFEDRPFAELATVLRNLADRLDNADGREFTAFEFSGIRDSNGNRVGQCAVKISRAKVQS